MSPDVLWNVKGVRREARETARMAARRSGLSVGEWLNSVIIQSAQASPATAMDTPEHIRAETDGSSNVRGNVNHLARGSAAHGSRARTAAGPDLGGGAEPSPHEIAEVMLQLGRRLEQLMDDDAAARPADPALPLTDRLSKETAARLARSPPAEGWPDALDRAADEIAPGPRQANDEVEADAAWRTDPQPRTPEAADMFETAAADLSALEHQLQSVTSQLERLQNPSPLDAVVEVLRGELRAFGQAFIKAVPRQAIEALQKEVGGLSDRLEHGRNSGVDAAALAGLEQGLAEVRDALGRLVSAESLQGFEQVVLAISDKLDGIAAAGRDSPVLKQLEAAVVGLRGILSRVASNDALNDLAGEVRMLSVRVDRSLAIGQSSSELLKTIDKRIAAIAGAIEEFRTEPGRRPAAGDFNAVLAPLHAKLDQLQSAHLDRPALGQIEKRITTILEKLEASEARLGRFETVERGLAGLLIRLEELRASGGEPVSRRSEPRMAAAADGGPRKLTEQPGEHEAAHGSLGAVIDRLAMLDAEMRLEARARAPNVPRVPSPAQGASSANAESFHDHPIEPGSARPHAAPPGSPGARTNAPNAAESAGSKSNFIAAARRAAQAAAASERGEPGAGRSEVRSTSPVGSRVENTTGKLVKSVVVGIGIVALTLTALRLGLYDVGANRRPVADIRPAVPAPAGAPAADVPSPTGTVAGTRTESETPTARSPGKSSAVSSSSVALDLVPGGDPLAMGLPASGLIPSGSSEAQAAMSRGAAEVTGSIESPRQAPPGPGPSAGAPAEKPPAASVALLTQAATAGDGAAAYELATRYAEGRGVSANLEEAARWFERAAGQNLAPAQFRLGSLYEKGLGVRKDLQEARRLYLAAADKGNAKAMHNLAVLYAEGLDGQPDYRTAVEWFRKAAERDVADSQYNLGVLYARGIGVSRNFSESFKWFALAALHGDRDAAKKRDEVAGRLDPQSLALARTAVQNWKPTPQPDEAVTVKLPSGGWTTSVPRTLPPATRPRAHAPKRITAL